MWSRAVSDYSCRNTGNNSEGGDVTGNDRPRTDNCPLPDRDVLEQYGPESDPSIITDNDIAIRVQCLLTNWTISSDTVVIGIETAVRGNRDPVADANGADVGREVTSGLYVGVRTDAHRATLSRLNDRAKVQG